MTSEKNQHYVPQFHLRYFSDSDEKLVNLYNLGRKSVLLGTIKDQCSKPYFYSDNPEVETLLSNLEDKAARNIEKIINGKNITAISNKDYVDLLSFVATQYGRTKQAGKMNMELVNIIFEQWKPLILSHAKGKLTEKDLEGVKIDCKHPALMPTFDSLISGALLTDLQPILLLNNTQTEFITSDNPVVLFNSYFSGGIMGSLGFCSKGLQIFFPLSPKELLMWYDPAYYEVTESGKYYVLLRDEKDIRRLNGLQILHCGENVYFKSKSHESEIRLQHRQISFKRVSDKFKTASLGTWKKQGKIHEVIGFHKKNVIYDLRKLTFLRIKKDVDPLPGIRDPALLEEHSAFIKSVEEQAKQKWKLERSPTS